MCPKLRKQLVAAFESGELSEAELDQRVRRILLAKENSQAGSTGRGPKTVHYLVNYLPASRCH